MGLFSSPEAIEDLLETARQRPLSETESNKFSLNKKIIRFFPGRDPCGLTFQSHKRLPSLGDQYWHFCWWLMQS